MKRSFFEPLLKGHFTVFCGSFAAVRAHIKKLGLDDATAGRPRLAKTLFLEHSDGRDSCLIWFSDEACRSANRPGVIAHEAHHAVTMTLEARGLHAETISGEMGAYYLEWLIARINQALHR